MGLFDIFNPFKSSGPFGGINRILKNPVKATVDPKFVISNLRVSENVPAELDIGERLFGTTSQIEAQMDPIFGLQPSAQRAGQQPAAAAPVAPAATPQVPAPPSEQPAFGGAGGPFPGFDAAMLRGATAQFPGIIGLNPQQALTRAATFGVSGGAIGSSYRSQAGKDLVRNLSLQAYTQNGTLRTDTTVHPIVRQFGREVVGTPRRSAQDQSPERFLTDLFHMSQGGSTTQ